MVMVKSRSGNGPKKLEDLEVDEVSIVDRPANQTPFLLTKRLKKETAMKTIEELAKAAKESLEKLQSALEEQTKALHKNEKDAAPTLADVLKAEGEGAEGAFDELKADIVKMFGEEELVKRDERLEGIKSVLEATLKVEGLTDETKKSLTDAIATIDGIAKAEEDEDEKEEDEEEDDEAKKQLKALADKLQPVLEKSISDSLTKSLTEALDEKFVSKGVFDEFAISVATALKGESEGDGSGE